MDIPEVMNEDVLKEELNMNRSITAEKYDRDMIIKMHELVMSLALAHCKELYFCGHEKSIFT